MEIHAMFLSSMVGSAVGQEFVSETSRGIIGHIKSIWSYQDPSILEIMEKYDIRGRTKIIESIVNDIHQQIEDKTLRPSKTLLLALEQIEEILDSISQTIEKIDQGIEIHKTLWFHRWRTPEYAPQLKKLDIYQQNMGIRYDNLVKIMALNHHVHLQGFEEKKSDEKEPCEKQGKRVHFNPKISIMTDKEHLEEEKIVEIEEDDSVLIRKYD